MQSICYDFMIVDQIVFFSFFSVRFRGLIDRSRTEKFIGSWQFIGQCLENPGTISLKAIMLGYLSKNMNLIKTLVNLPGGIAEDLLAWCCHTSIFRKLDESSRAGFLLYSELYRGDVVKNFVVKFRSREYFCKHIKLFRQVTRFVECLSFKCRFNIFDDDIRLLGSYPNLKCLELDNYYLSDECLRLSFSGAGTIEGYFQNLVYLSLRRTHMTAEHLSSILKLPQLLFMRFSVGIPNPHKRAYDRLHSCCFSRAQSEIDETGTIDEIIKGNGFTKTSIQIFNTLDVGLLAEELAGVFYVKDLTVKDIPSSNLCQPWRYQINDEIDWTPELAEWYPEIKLKMPKCRHFKHYDILRAGSPPAAIKRELKLLMTNDFQFSVGIKVRSPRCYARSYAMRDPSFIGDYFLSD